MSLMSRLAHSWNSFVSAEEQPTQTSWSIGSVSSSRPDRPRFRVTNERTIISSIYTRMAIDVAGIKIEHVRVDDNGQYVDTISSGLNDCLNVGANIDQAGRQFRMDIPLTMFGAGVACVVCVDTTQNPTIMGSWDVKSMRVGEVIQWYPQDVKVRLYNEKTGLREDLILPKNIVAVIENPFYSVMNEPNSTLQRLLHKLNLLDNVDEISSQGKLDIIIQLPYVIKSESRQKQAEQRREQIETQLKSSTYGIAYTDGTEKITQLNRSIENNLLAQVEYLTNELYTQLGLTPEIMNGTADDVVMNNYINRTVEPIMDAITEEMARKFLTKTARTQGQSIMYFQTPFKLIPISQLAKIVDVLSRNQIVTPNEVRPALGLKPSGEPQANTLVNSNMPLKDQVTGGDQTVDPNASPDTLDPNNPDDAAELSLDSQMADLGIS